MQKQFQAHTRRLFFVLTWKSLLPSLVLCKTSVWLHNQLRRKKFQNTMFNKIPHSKLIHLKVTNKNLPGRIDQLADKTLSCPCIKLSNFKNWICDSVKFQVSLSDVAQQQRRNTAIIDNCSTLLDAAGASSTLVLLKNDNAKESVRQVHFKI